METGVVGISIAVIPIRFVYFICLFGATIEDILGFGQERESKYQEAHDLIKICRVILLILGDLWLWSNMGLGLFGLLICSIAYSICDTRFPQYNNKPRKLSENTELFRNIFQLIRFTLRHIAGIVWLWSHIERVLYLSPLAVAVAVVCVFAIKFRGIGPGKSSTKAIQDKELVEPYTRTGTARQIFIERSLNFICRPLVFSFIVYKAIIFMSKLFWGKLFGRMLPIEYAANVSDHQSNANHESMPKSRSGTSFQATIGHNVNHGGTQTIGSVTIGDYTYNIQINAGRDIVFNQFFTRDASRKVYNRRII